MGAFPLPTAAFPDSAPDDPYFANVTLLLHCDGADGSTTFTDVKGHVVVANGNVQIDTAQSKFGGAAAYFDGVGDYLTVAHATAFDIATSANFTAECWVCWEAAPTDIAYVMAGAAGTTTRWGVYWRQASGNCIRFWDGASGWDGRTPLQAGVWYHLAVTRRLGGTLEVYLDGALELYILGKSMEWNCDALWIGMQPGATYPLKGWIDDVRYTTVVGRYAPAPPVAVAVPGGFSCTFAHTWAAQDRTLYPVRPTVDLRDTAERYPSYAAQAGINLTDLPRNGRIAGTLLNGGFPQAHTWVFLTYRSTNQVVAAKKTATDGTFEFRALYPYGRYLVTAYQSRTEPPTSNMVSADYIEPVVE